jgi:hypothetical protein
LILKTSKQNFVAAIALIGLVVGFSQQDANAADPAEVCQPLAATLEADYMMGNDALHHFNEDIPPTPHFDVREDADFYSFSGNAAALYNFCDTGINAQVDGAYIDHEFKHGFEETAHAGGILFLRDQNLGLLGLDGSYLWRTRHYEFAGPDTKSNWSRIGLRGEWFANEYFTLGARVGHVNGDTAGYKLKGFEETAWARVYATPNLAFMAKLDAAQFDFIETDIKNWTVSGEAEYLVPDQHISLLAGGRYAMKHSTYLGNGFVPNTQNENYVEGFVGLKIYLGGTHQANTLVAQHRSNTLDNRSMFFEGTPGSNSFMDK